MIYYAKHRNGQESTVLDHTKMVINLSIAVAKDRIKNIDNQTLKKIAVAAALHDLGKCTKSFQNCLGLPDSEGLESDEKTVDFHNAVSWAFAYSCVGALGSGKYRPIRSAVLYHHTLKGDTDASSSDIIGRLIDNDPEGFKAIKEHYAELMAYIDERFSLGITEDPDFIVRDVEDVEDMTSGYIKDESVYPEIKGVFDTYKTDEIAFGKKFKKHQENCWDMGFIRAIVVYADRAVSSGNYDLTRILNNDTEYIGKVYENHIKTDYSKEPDFSGYGEERLSSQRKLVEDLSAGENGIYDISASAGFGKTLVGLMYHFKEGRKTMWVVPRIIIADGAYRSIVSELEKMGMSDEVKVGLMYGGQFKEGDASSDIIVSVIDTFLGRYSQNDLSAFLIDSYFGNIIFDEYHEFVCKEPLFSAFVNTVYARNTHTDTKTILLSATGLGSTLERLVGGNVNVMKPEIYGGDTEVEIHVKTLNSIDSVELDPDTESFTIMPTVGSAQQLYGRNGSRERMLIHARYTDTDRAEHEKELYDMYGKHGTKERVPVIGTSIIGTGLDVSARGITHYMPTPDATIQISCGRSARFNEHKRVTYTVIKCGDSKKFLGTFYDTGLRNLWVDLLKTLDGKVVTKRRLYELRDEFYAKHRKKFTEFVMFRYRDSSEELSEISYRNGGSGQSLAYGVVSKHTSYRGAPTNFYVVTKKMEEPMTCETNVVLANESNATEDSKERYNYMVDSPNFLSKQELKYGFYKIRKWSDATKERCSELAWRSDRALLLLRHDYTKELGLFPTGTDEEEE